MVEDLAQQGETADLTGMEEGERPRCPECGRAVVANGKQKRRVTYENGRAAEAVSRQEAENISYFSRSYRAREFEYYALSELHQRGVFNAETVVSVNDGAAVNQSFLDYHFPKAIRIIDFWHTIGYLAEAGKAVWGEESERGKQSSPPTTFASLKAAGLLSEEEHPPFSNSTTPGPWRPPADHPWRNNKWPTYEIRNWN